MIKPIIKVKNLNKYYWNGKYSECILKDISFDVNKGELVIIKGTSGSGKSTLLKILAGIVNFNEGELSVLGMNLHEIIPKNEWRAKNIGFIFQFHSLLTELTVEDNLLVVADIAGWNYKKMRKRADEILFELGLPDKVKLYPDLLSGGERQRVAIGRAIMNDPPLILADEPTASLDNKRAMSTFQLLKRIGKEQRKTIIMATHDERFLLEADRVFELNNGSISEVKSSK